MDEKRLKLRYYQIVFLIQVVRCCQIVLQLPNLKKKTLIILKLQNLKSGKID